MTTIRIFYKGKWETAVRIKDNVPDYAILDMAMAIDADPTIPHENVAIVDQTNGEVLWDAVWEDENGKIWDTQELLERGFHFVNGEPMRGLT